MIQSKVYIQISSTFISNPCSIRKALKANSFTQEIHAKTIEIKNNLCFMEMPQATNFTNIIV